MAGYSTLFQELEETLHLYPKAKIDLVFLQAGVGSFAGAGINYYLDRYGANRPKIVIVEPKEADGILSSLIKGEITTSKGNNTTIMAGLNCGTPSLGAWDKQAIRVLYYPNNPDKRIISGESGVGGLAGFISIMTEDQFELLQKELNICSTTNILFISTEGATDENTFNEIIKN